jgi:hypothetical protein
MAFKSGLISKALSWVKPQAAGAAAQEAKIKAGLRRQVELGKPYASLEPELVKRDFNVSGFQRGTKIPKPLK